MRPGNLASPDRQRHASKGFMFALQYGGRRSFSDRMLGDWPADPGRQRVPATRCCCCCCLYRIGCSPGSVCCCYSPWLKSELLHLLLSVAVSAAGWTCVPRTCCCCCPQWCYCCCYCQAAVVAPAAAPQWAYSPPAVWTAQWAKFRCHHRRQLA